MSTNKIVFAILGAIILGLIIMLALQLNASPTSKTTTQKSDGDMSIWIFGESRGDFESYIASFKQLYPQYENKRIIVESFETRKSYQDILTASIVNGNAPDIFMMNNSEISPLQNQVLGIDPAKLSPNDFRLRFKPVFSQDLIIQSENDETVEFLAGVPVGYQSIGLIYNRRYFLKPSELETWGKLRFELSEISKKSNILPLAIGDGSSVTQAPLLLSSLLVQEGVEDLVSTTTNESRQALTQYTSISPKYNILASGSPIKTDIDFFTQGEVAAMLGTPKDLKNISDIGYQSSLLFVSPFPKSEGEKVKQAISYDYFVINKDTIHLTMSEDFLTFVASGEGQKKYLELFPATLPATTELELELAEKKILPKFNVVYKNFINPELDLVSYKVENLELFERKMRSILDKTGVSESLFNEEKNYIICTTNKYKTFENLSSPCK